MTENLDTILQAIRLHIIETTPYHDVTPIISRTKPAQTSNKLRIAPNIRLTLNDTKIRITAPDSIGLDHAIEIILIETDLNDPHSLDEITKELNEHYYQQPKLPPTINPYHHLKPGNTVTRNITNSNLLMPLTITNITDTEIHCGPWTFCRQTGAEIDPDLNWGPWGTGSYLLPPKNQ